MNVDMTSSTKGKFFSRGMRAFETGLPCVPMMDPEVMEMLKELDSPIVSSLKMWYEGWNVKNLGVM